MASKTELVVVLFLSLAAACLTAPPRRLYVPYRRTLRDDADSPQDSPRSVEIRDHVTFYNVPSETRRELPENDEPEGVETQEKATFYSGDDGSVRKRMFRVRNHESVEFEKERVFEFEPNTKPHEDQYEGEDYEDGYGMDTDPIPYLFPWSTDDVPEAEDQEQRPLFRMRQSESKHFEKERVVETQTDARPETPPEAWVSSTDEAADNTDPEPGEGSENEIGEVTNGVDDEEPEEGSEEETPGTGIEIEEIELENEQD